MSVTQIDLHPDITFDDGFSVGEEKLKKMQERAHNYCFIANTLADSVMININNNNELVYAFPVIFSCLHKTHHQKLLRD